MMQTCSDFVQADLLQNIFTNNKQGILFNKLNFLHAETKSERNSPKMQQARILPTFLT